MPIIYPDNVKSARMTAVKTALGTDGKLEVGSTGMTVLIAEVPLGTGGTVSSAGVWTLVASAVSDPAANATARASEARLRSSVNEDVVTGLTVGLKSAAAPAWAGTTAYSLGAFVTNGANQYKCITAGTSAASGGPTGQGATITDGTVTWEYCSVANADIQVSNVDVTLGEAFQIDSASITHA
jgi:hypothetical protein